MKYALMACILLSGTALFARILPEDKQKIALLKTELKQDENRVHQLQRKIARQRENIARESSEASRRAAEQAQSTTEALVH